MARMLRPDPDYLRAQAWERLEERERRIAAGLEPRPEPAPLRNPEAVERFEAEERARWTAPVRKAGEGPPPTPEQQARRDAATAQFEKSERYWRARRNFVVRRSAS